MQFLIDNNIVNLNYLQFEKSLRWCPSPGCSYAAKKYSLTLLYSCKCNCGEDFCFECGDLCHELITCMQLEKFKVHDDATYKWIVEHAKQCPKCRTVIEKNGGCNHMVILFQMN